MTRLRRGASSMTDASSNSAADALQEQMPVGTPLLYYVICGAMTKHPGWEEDAKLIYEAVGEWFAAHAIPNVEAAANAVLAGADEIPNVLSDDNPNVWKSGRATRNRMAEDEAGDV